MSRTGLLLVLVIALAAVAQAKSPYTRPACTSFKHSRVVRVGSTESLDRALRSGRCGDLILMGNGRYRSATGSSNWHRVVIQNKKCSAARPFTVCGGAGAVIDNGSPSGLSGMQILSSSYVNLVGFTVQNSQKGIEMERSSHCRIDGVTVRNTGLEGIHLQKGSNYNLIVRCHITNTGRTRKGNGEGVYIGSDDSRGVDRMTNNHVLYNRIGPGVTADGIDVKQYTRNSVIKGNIMDGRSLCGCNSATSLINVKGNNHKVLANYGRNSIEDMFKVAKTNSGEGRGNYFAGNRCVSGLPRGFYCARVPDFGGGNKSPNRIGCSQKRSNAGCRGL